MCIIVQVRFFTAGMENPSIRHTCSRLESTGGKYYLGGDGRLGRKGHMLGLGLILALSSLSSSFLNECVSIYVCVCVCVRVCVHGCVHVVVCLCVCLCMFSLHVLSLCLPELMTQTNHDLLPHQCCLLLPGAGILSVHHHN